MFKFLIIAPYRGLKDLLEDMAEELPYEIHAEVGDLQQGLTIAKAAEQQKYDVIISRGGTAKLIRQHVRIPVIEIAVNGYDILRSLTFLKEYPGKVGIIGFPNIVNGVDTIAELLDMQVMKFVIHHEDQAASAVQQAKEQGVSLVIGDVITVATSENYGLKAILITSGREAILEVLERAKETVLSRLEKHQEMAFIKQLLNTMGQGVIGVHADGSIQFYNQTAAEIFGVSAEQAVRMKWGDFLTQAQISLEADRGEEFVQVVVGKAHYNQGLLIYGKPMADGGMNYTIYRKEDIRLLQQQFRRAEEDRFSPPASQFQHFVKTDFIKASYMDRAEQWSELADPIVIVGESGTGKRSLAEAMHNRSGYHKGPFVVLYADLTPSDQLGRLLFGSDSGESDENALVLRAEAGTLYIHNIEYVPLPSQRRLAAMLQASNRRGEGAYSFTPPFRLIVSTSDDLEEKVRANEFDRQLFTLLQPHMIHMPPLRSFIEDLDHLVFWYLAEMNRSLGKQVLGIKPDVMKLLKSYHWPGNMLELKRVLKVLIESSDGSFVTMQQAEPILASIFERPAPEGALRQLVGKDRTLEEIERDIIRIVLEQEGFNQSTTAKRLGINRTTLWRKLNQE
ncbi:PrpR N-terminal domain-containing protein [Paenibacillus validus]|uniref:PrpR N-terminal domain-containing protein n=1 Tax=Paenibacillus TaxID=44249 RepID=UPI000FDC95E6|nr:MULTISPECIES: PrpR N-terminal domain-containing protein [Paenibacillus]MED4600663.1 PrpR N-terminal domain-containing protein [Paenibacillus validus]MED4605302.1 PrpR N-terminal domain-containing protein [Paenibacillus validus]